MEDKGSLNIHINIYGGTNQILPNATKAAQYFHRDAELTVKPALAEDPHPWTSEDESRLSLYRGRTPANLCRYPFRLHHGATGGRSRGRDVRQRAQVGRRTDCQRKVHPTSPALPRQGGERQRHRQPPSEHQQRLAEPQEATQKSILRIVARVSNNKRPNILG